MPSQVDLKQSEPPMWGEETLQVTQREGPSLPSLSSISSPFTELGPSHHFGHLQERMVRAKISSRVGSVFASEKETTRPLVEESGSL